MQNIDNHGLQIKNQNVDRVGVPDRDILFLYFAIP